MNILKLLGVKNWLFPIIFFEYLDTGDDKVKNLIRECIFYIICLFSIAVSSLTHTGSFEWYDLIDDQIIQDYMVFSQDKDTINKHISKVSNIDQMWQGIENILSASDLWAHWYKWPPFKDKNKYIHSFLLGPPRIRQVRVKNDTCQVDSHFKKYFEYCYDYYNYRSKAKTPFGSPPGNSPVTAWTYTYPIDLGGMSYIGKVTTYDAGGYYIDLSYNMTETLELLNQLKTNLWVDRHTAAVFVDINLYNHNINDFICLKIVFELPPTGGVVYSAKVKNNKLLLYKFKQDYFVFACDFLFMLYNTYYILNITYGCDKYGVQFMYDKWRVLELVLVLLGFVLKIARGIINFISQVNFNKFKETDGQFINFEVLGYLCQHYANMTGLFFFLSCVKMFKYIGFGGVLGQLNAAITKAVTPIIGFFVTFVIFFFGYAILGYLQFGGDVKDFSTAGRAMFTLFCSIQDVFNYKQLLGDNYGRFYLMTYVVILGFILLNMFLAIISSSYWTVRNEILAEQPASQWLNVLKRGAYRMTRRCPPRIQDMFNLKRTTEEFVFIKTILRMAKYDNKELNLFFVKYKVEKDITVEAARDFIKEIHENGFEMEDAAEYVKNRTDFEQFVTPQQFLNQNIQLEALQRNINTLDYMLIQFAHNIDKLIVDDHVEQEKELEKKMNKNPGTI